MIRTVALEGILEAAKKGVLAGYPVMGFKAIVYNGSYYEVDSSDLAFQFAASMAFKKVMAEASPTLLEPIYEIKVLAPQERVGDILSDLQARRGRILGMEQEGALAAVRAEVPLAEVLEYYKALPGLTGGAGAYNPGVQPLPGGAPAPGPEDRPEPGPGGLRWPWSA